MAPLNANGATTPRHGGDAMRPAVFVRAGPSMLMITLTRLMDTAIVGRASAKALRFAHGHPEVPRAMSQPAVEPHFRPQIDAFLRVLEASPKVRVTESTIGKPASMKDLRAVEKRLGLGPRVLDLWREANGVHIEWKADDGFGGTEAGGVHVPPLDGAFRDWSDTFYQDYDPPDDPKRRFYLLDKMPGDGAISGVVLDGSDDPPVHFLDCAELYPLGVRLREYLPLVTRVRGFMFWQMALVADAPGGRESTIEPRVFRTMLPRVFPEVNPGELLRRDYGKADAKFRKHATKVVAGISAAFEKHGVGFTVDQRMLAIGTIRVEVEPARGNATKAEQALVEHLGPEWKGFFRRGGSSIGDIGVSLKRR